MAENEDMIIDTAEGQDTPAEVTAESLLDDLNKEPEEPAEQDTGGEQEPDEPTPEEKRTEEIKNGLQSLIDEGWQKGELDAFVMDPGVKQDIASGKSVEQATIAYLRRTLNAQTEKPASKKSVPTVRSASPGRKTDSDASRIANMSDKEFDEFARRADRAARQGKRVLI